MYVFKPFVSIVPEVEQPDRKADIRTKAVWTFLVVLIYLMCCQIPLYGMIRNNESDPFYWLRIILASNRGSLMELGISPIVTASMIMQLLVGAKLLKFDQKNKE